MIQDFSTYFEEKYPNLKQQTIGLACSGGVDSMFLAYLLKQIDVQPILLHCNFNLRSEESDKDQALVEAFAKENKLPLKIKSFDTQTYASEHRVSIQMAARELRYAWFNELLDYGLIACVATGHHADDDLETTLINLGRSSGLKGLIGIPEDKKYIRPLLAYSKAAIYKYATKCAVPWREDASNTESDYLRNYLRNKVIPLWKDKVPHLLEAHAQSKKHLQASINLLEDYINSIKRNVWREGVWGVEVSIEKLKSYPNHQALLYELLESYGFTAWEDVYSLLDAQSGKQVLSSDYRLIKDRELLLLARIQEVRTEKIILEDVKDLQSIGQIFHNKGYKVFKLASNPFIFVSSQKFQFPAVLRPWEAGDFFYPTGMLGKKKLSKYFKDQKYNLLEKEAIWVLTSDDDIVWVVGHRMDRRFVSDETKGLKIKV